MGETHLPGAVGFPHPTGYLPETDGHSVRYETFGTPGAPPALLLHGGPGAGMSPGMVALFDPAEWWIVTMDQRGSGRSRPHAGDDLAALEANTTAHLIADIERLREGLGIDRWLVCGVSWGSTLALAYAMDHPGRVSGLLLGSVTTTGPAEIENFCIRAGDYLPEAFETFRALAPGATTGQALAAVYAQRMADPDPEVVSRAVSDWMGWEVALATTDPRAPVPGPSDARFATGFARIVTHYFAHHGFRDPPLLDRLADLPDVPAILVNSRMDITCPLVTAWRIHRALPRSELVVIPGGLHSTRDGPLAEAMQQGARWFAARHKRG